MEQAFFVPILPGKLDDARTFADALIGSRRTEFDSAQATVTKESWFIQETPMGAFIIVYFQAPDVDAVFNGLAASSEPFDVWFKERVLEITGVDCNEPMPSSPKQVLNWSRG
jgi:hypothetical protein